MVGADPELFFKYSNGSFASVIGRLGGSKEKPMSIGSGCAVQEDNVAAEFNIPPATSADKFVESINYNLQYLQARAKEMKLKLAIVPSAEFSPKELANPAARVFGCEPDYNAWALEVNEKPRSKNKMLRSAGGHIHLATEDDPIQTIRAMDLFIGAQLVAVDKDKKRRELYGKAGAFRQKDYGVEYRTPSNYWITKESLMRWVFDQCNAVKEWVSKGNQLENDEMGNLIQQCINTSSVKDLAKINKYYGLSPISA